MDFENLENWPSPIPALIFLGCFWPKLRLNKVRAQDSVNRQDIQNPLIAIEYNIVKTLTINQIPAHLAKNEGQVGVLFIFFIFHEK